MRDLCHIDIISGDKKTDLWKSLYLRLALEPDNAMDKRAVAVYDDDEKIGYVLKLFRGLATEELNRGSSLVVVKRWSSCVWGCALVNDGALNVARAASVGNVKMEKKEMRAKPNQTLLNFKRKAQHMSCK